MSPKLARQYLTDGSFIERAIDQVTPDRFRPHGFHYRFAWIQSGKCRVLFDNHHRKQDHFHVDGVQCAYQFVTIERVLHDFLAEIRKLGGEV